MVAAGAAAAVVAAGAEAVRGLLRFVIGLTALLVGAEVLARAFEPQLSAASDRTLFKLELLRRHAPTRRVLIGTSRFNGGREGAPLQAFNLSVPSSSLALQRWQFDRALKRQGLLMVVLEVSPPLLQGSAKPPAVSDEPLALLRNRRGLALENLPRLAALPFAARFHGAEFFRTRWFREWWTERQGVGPAVFEGEPTRVPGAQRFIDGEQVRALAAMAEKGRAHGMRTVFVAPPVDADRRAEQCGGEFELFLKQLSLRGGEPVLDYSCLELPADFFISNAHLSAKGRAWFTASMKEQLDAVQ